MIANQRQYNQSLARLAEIKLDIKQFDEIALIRQGIDPILVGAQRRSLESERGRLERNIARYTALRDGRVDQLVAKDIAGLGSALIEARLALGLTQRELASRLNVKEQQIQRYEQERYQSASLTRLQEVARALDADSTVEIRLPDRPSPKSSALFDARLLPINEMKARGWLSHIKLPEATERSDLALAEHFIRSAPGGNSLSALHRQRVRDGGKVDSYAIAAWKARVLHIAKRRRPTNVRFGPLDSQFIRSIVRLSAHENGPPLALEMLLSRGVIVVIEPHLVGTHLDGAAMLLENNLPVIGLTLRHDRLDNFWFVLMHEIGHIVCHRERGLEEGFFDDESAPAVDQLEKEADDFAQNALIPTEIWNDSFVRFTRDKTQVISYASKLGISPSIVAGRIQHERGDFKLFSDLVGRGTVRRQFS